MMMWWWSMDGAPNLTSYTASYTESRYCAGSGRRSNSPVRILPARSSSSTQKSYRCHSCCPSLRFLSKRAYIGLYAVFMSPVLNAAQRPSSERTILCWSYSLENVPVRYDVRAKPNRQAVEQTIWRVWRFGARLRSAAVVCRRRAAEGYRPGIHRTCRAATR